MAMDKAMIDPDAPVAPAFRRNVGNVERVASVIGGTGLAYYALRRLGIGGLVMLAAGGGLIYRGATGRSTVYRKLGINGLAQTTPDLTEHLQSDHQHQLETLQTVRLVATMTINQPAHVLYRFWRNFENLPAFMHHVKSVTVHDPVRSTWVVQAPFGATASWDAEITDDEPNSRIAWRSTMDADVVNAGEVRFIPTVGNRGTEVQVHIGYIPPGGKIALGVARLFGEAPDQRVREDLRRFKQVMEAGEIPTTNGQASYW